MNGLPISNSKQSGATEMKPILVTEVGGSVGGLEKKIVGNLLDARIPLPAVALSADRRPCIPKPETTHG